MRKAEFAVPTEVMAEFAQELADQNIDNRIVGINDDCEILVTVEYDREQSDEIDQLEERLNELREQIEEEEEEQEE